MSHPSGCCCPHHRAVPGTPVGSLVWLLLLLAAGVAVWKADVVSSLATAVELAVCTVVPVGWAVRQMIAELALRRLYDRPPSGAGARKVIEHRVVPALPPVPPLAAGRFVIDVETQR